MTEKHDHGNTEDDCDWEILKLANDKGIFGIEMGMNPCEHVQAAFERGVEKGWWILIDVNWHHGVGAKQPVRMFKLTNYGESRRAVLGKKFAKTITH